MKSARLKVSLTHPRHDSATELLERLYPVSKRVSEAISATGIDFIRKDLTIKINQP